MWESLRNAWSGWLDFTDGGKLAVLIIASAGYLLLGKKRRGPQRRLAVYGCIASLLCIFPVTAAVLMAYQTAFYDYPWIWSAVPFTAVIALGGTVFLTDCWKPGKGWRTILHNAGLSLLCVGVLVLCGGLGESNLGEESGLYMTGGSSAGGAEAVGERQRREAVSAVLEELCASYAEDGAEDGFCLWAPREILEYARAESGQIRLLYGRNMWDAALNAYSYDVCSAEQQDLYQWMERLTEESAEVSAAEGQEYVRKAFSMGADCVLLPGEIQGWNPAETDWEKDCVEAEAMGQYYLLRMR